MSADGFVLHAKRNVCRAGLALLVAAANASAADADSGPGSAGDKLQFLDGTSIHGTFDGADTSHGLHWDDPDAKNPFDLLPSRVDSLRLARAKSVAISPSCHFQFASGDDLYGSLVSLDGESMEFKTWFGGIMKIPRSAVQTITFLPTNYSIVYEGPSDSTGWVIASGRQMGGRRGGGGMFIFGGAVVQSDMNSAAGPPYWTYHDGSFSSSGLGSLGHDFNLGGTSATIDFDLVSTGNLNLLLDLFAPALDRIDMNGGSFLVELDSGQITARRAGRFSSTTDLGNVLMTNFANQGRGHFTIHCNKENSSITALLDGKLLKRWTDVGGFGGVGGGLVFVNQSGIGAVKLSNIKISQWDGKYEPDVVPVAPTNSDIVSFINHDKASGKIGDITGGQLKLTLGASALKIPVERIRQIDLQQPAVLQEPRGPWEVRAVFPGGGSVSFRLEKWDAHLVMGRSALFGEVTFQADSIRLMQFNLDRARTTASPAVENDFEALDQ